MYGRCRASGEGVEWADMVKVTKSLVETHDEARKFLASLAPKDVGATVVALKGDLGAGKTAFTQGIALALGVEEAVTSPTFVLEKVYRLVGHAFSRLIHIDAYRLEGVDELRQLGWDELVRDPGNLICVEWGERILEALPKDTRWIEFTFLDTKTRQIDFKE